MTIAFKNPAKTTYVPLSEKAERDAALKLMTTANGDTERLLLSPEERARIAAEAERVATRGTRKLSAEQVWQETINKVAYMNAEAGHGLKEVFPPVINNRMRVVPNKDRKIVAVQGAPHAGIGLIAIIDAGRGREIAIYGGNAGGRVSVENGAPKLIDIKPADEMTQNEPRYFGVVQQRLENGQRNVSKQPLFMDMNNINDVAKRCCELLGIPAPTKTYEYVKDRKAAEKKPESIPAVKSAPTASTAPKAVPAHQAHARSLWSGDREPSYDLTIAEQRAIRAAQMQSTPQPEPVRYAYGM